MARSDASHLISSPRSCRWHGTSSSLPFFVPAWMIPPMMQTGRPALIKKDGGEMLIAIVLDRPLAEAKALVEAPMRSSKPSLGSCKTNRTTQSATCSGSHLAATCCNLEKRKSTKSFFQEHVAATWQTLAAILANHECPMLTSNTYGGAL